jgi:aminoglycoside 6'-N-acetyltransferase I
LTDVTIIIRQILTEDYDEWLRLRSALWPRHKTSDLKFEMEKILADPEQPVFVAARSVGDLCGFLEVSIRKWAEGCTSNRIGYLEGWYVDPGWRNRSIGRKLVEAAEKWARGKNCSEMASDTDLDYPLSPKAHTRLGYQEVQRTIHFRKKLS